MGDSSPTTTRQAGANRLDPDGTPLRLEAAAPDQASTMVDSGLFAPTQIFVEAFAESGIAIMLDEAHGPMGLDKWDHIRMLYNDDAIAARSSLTHGHVPTDDDITAVCNRFMPLQTGKVGMYSAMIPDVLDIVTTLYEASLKIDTCFGYPRMVMDRMVGLATKVGYTLNCVVARDEMPRAHPWPAQALRYVVNLAIGDVTACVRAGNIMPGIGESRRAGMWTVVLLVPGNMLGLPYEQYTTLSTDERTRHRIAIFTGFAACHPHYEVNTIAGLPEVVADINRCPMRGRRPQCI